MTDIKAAVKIFMRQMGSSSPRPIFTTSVDVDGSFSDSHIKSSFPKSLRLRPLTAKKEKNKKPSARKKPPLQFFFKLNPSWIHCLNKKPSNVKFVKPSNVFQVGSQLNNFQVNGSQRLNFPQTRHYRD